MREYYHCILAMVNVTTENTMVAVVNSTVTFVCKPNANNLILWDYFETPHGRPLPIYDDGNLHPSVATRYTVSNNTTIGQNDLVIRNVLLSDAGFYRCLADSDRQRDNAANTMGFHLTVLGMSTAVY